MANISTSGNLQINFAPTAQNKPITGYPGGKAGAGTFQTIICQIPPISVYVEAMVGGGGIFNNLRLPGRTVINDYESSVIEKYRGITAPGVKIETYCKDYRDLIAGIVYDRSQNMLIYFDPPYLMETRSYQGKLYKKEFTREDHIDLINYAAALKCMVMISHYPCKLYDDGLKGWRTLDYESMTRKGLRTERLYMNYPAPAKLQDYRYIGEDFTDRQRIKRKIEREVKKLHRLPALERNAILQAIIEKYKP